MLGTPFSQTPPSILKRRKPLPPGRGFPCYRWYGRLVVKERVVAHLAVHARSRVELAKSPIVPRGSSVPRLYALQGLADAGRADLGLVELEGRLSGLGGSLLVAEGIFELRR